MDNQKIQIDRVITFIGIFAGVILLVGLSVKGIAYLFPSEKTKALSKMPWETESEFTFGNDEKEVETEGEAFHLASKNQKLTAEEIKFEKQQQEQQKKAAAKKKAEAKTKTTPSKKTATQKTATQKPTTTTTSNSTKRPPSTSTSTQRPPAPERSSPPPSAPTISKSFPGRQHFSEGKSNKYVTQLGHLLVNAGYDRYYTVGPGPEFTSADKRNTQAFQKSQGWTGSDADGYPGPETWKRLVDRWNRNH